MTTLVRRSSLFLTGAALFVSSALAAKVCITTETQLPNVNEEGLLEDSGEDNGNCQVCVNTKNGKARGKCTGAVENASNASQKYKDDDFFADEDVQKSLYKVKADGSAKLTLKGVVPV